MRVLVGGPDCAVNVFLVGGIQNKIWNFWDAFMSSTWYSNSVWHNWSNWFTALLLLQYIGEYICVFYKDEFLSSLGQVFGWNFSRIALSLKHLKLDSKADLITNGLILKFFVGIWVFSLASYVYGLKSVKIAQFFWRHQIFSIVNLRRVLLSSLNVPILFIRRKL